LKRRIHRPDLVIPVAQRLNYTIQAGPFAGLVYPPEIIERDGQFVPKLVGSYELEIQPFIREICRRSYSQVINIGAAEGYYAVGLAQHLPGAVVLAYECEPESRAVCEQLAAMNGVKERVLMRGLCDRDALIDALHSGDTSQPALVVCDCEGGELELLDPAIVPGLATADLLIELHDIIAPGITRTIAARFAPTHRLEFVRSVDRDPDVYPALHSLSPDDRAFLISEHRKGPMEWVLCTAIHRAAQPVSKRGSRS
jgi:predicted O-methyltransferase YrrM